ncbi:hypothetical protein V1272_001052 [Bradyrhizobium sp. AZCC 1708]
MGICVVRTVGGLSACPDAGSIAPRLDIAALPDSAAGMFGVALSATISAFGVLGPIQRQALAQKPFAEIGAADRTGRNYPAIWVKVDERAANRTSGNERVEVICCLRATTILRTVVVPAQLATLRRVDTPQPDSRSLNLQCVAINDTDSTNKVISQRLAREEQQHQYEYPPFDHGVEYPSLIANRADLISASSRAASVTADSQAARDSETPSRAASAPRAAPRTGLHPSAR